MDPTIYVLKDLTPLLTAGIGVLVVVVGWQVTRRRNRVDKLRDTWASWIASAFEATEMRSARTRAEDKARQRLEKIAEKHGAEVADRVASQIVEGLEGVERAASEAIWRLRRDFHLLQIIENDDRAIEPAASIINTLLEDSLDKYRLNGVRALIGHIAIDNRKRFLHPWRRWRRWRRPEPLRDPALDAAFAVPRSGASATAS